MSTCVLFGASGFLGRQISLAFAERGVEVVCVSRAGLVGIESRECDARDVDRVNALLDSLRPSAILNCAALSTLAACFADREGALLVNRDFPEALGAWAARHSARCVHVSTDQVFEGDAPGAGYREDAEAKPQSVYGESKRAGELALLAADSNALVVRLPLLFGDSLGRGLGASDSLLAAIERGERPALFTDEWRTPLAVEDAARALVELCWGDESGLLHLAGGERVTRFELGELVLAAQGLPQDSIRASVRSEAQASEPRARDVSLGSSCVPERVAKLLRGPCEYFGSAAD